jgi:hypothetical protein
MSVLAPRAHGYLDYLTVVLFALAPTVLGLTGLPAHVAYVLAIVHLLLTLVTHFPLGVAKIVPLPAHGAIELVVSIALVALPWLAGFSADATARWFYVVMGIVIFVVWLLTRYKG